MTAKKTQAELDADIEAYLAGPGGDAELQGDVERAKVLRKQAKIPRTGAKGGLLLGYTASGKSVHAPTRPGAPNTNDITVYTKTKAKYPGWTKADHMDAANIFEEASEVQKIDNPKLAKTLGRWSSIHWDIGGRWTGPEFEARFGHSRVRR